MGCLRGLHCAEFHTCCNKAFLKKSIEIDAVLLFVCAAQSEKRLWCRVLWLISRVCCHILLHNEPIKQWIIMASLFGLISNQICYRYKCLRPNLKRSNISFFSPLCSFVETNTVLYDRLTPQKTFCIDFVHPTLTVQAQRFMFGACAFPACWLRSHVLGGLCCEQAYLPHHAASKHRYAHSNAIISC